MRFVKKEVNKKSVKVAKGKNINATSEMVVAWSHLLRAIAKLIVAVATTCLILSLL
jgi:hypothetical protein